MIDEIPSSGVAPPQDGLIDAAWKQIALAHLPEALGRPAAGPEDRMRRSGISRDCIPGYRILGEVHRGGQGVVYRAVQQSTGRTVALKVMLGGAFAGPHQRARFAREVQVLAELRHPNIVAIHDCGAAGDAQYFVMDYVDGRPLDRYLDEAAPPLQDRLRLFVRICEAVNAAHVRGIIHRDLKPGNILVADDDGTFNPGPKGSALAAEGPRTPSAWRLNVEPKILDFGLAKLLQEPDADPEAPTAAPALTVTGQFVGSLAWASPEQARGRYDLIDLRTDVYALGVILHQMLTGALPYEVSGGMEAALQNIIHTDPANPRTRNPRLDDDPATIVLKALRKEREHRYETAGSLGRDVQRYLDGEPIEAKRDNSWYVLRRMIRRNRGVVLTGGAIAATLIVATVISLRFALQAGKAREQAERNAEETRQVAQFQSDLLSGIDVEGMGRGITNLFREEIRAALERGRIGQWPNHRERTPDEIAAQLAAFDELASAVQPADVARGVLDKNLLESVAATVESKFADQPGVQASLLHTLGTTYLSLGLYEQAERVLRRALELRRQEDPSHGILEAEAISHLAGAVSESGRARESEQLHREALAIYREHAEAGDPNMVRAMNNVGVLRSDLGDYAEAETMLRESLVAARALPAEHQDVLAEALSNLGGVLAHKAEYEEAEALVRESLALRRNVLGDEHPSVALTLANLGGLQAKRGDHPGAGESFHESLKVYRAAVGNEHPDLTFPMMNLAFSLQGQGKFAEATALYQEALALSRKTLGDDHPTTATILHQLGSVLLNAGEDSAAEPKFREALELFRAQLGSEHPKVANSLNSLGVLLRRRGQAAEAETVYREAVQIGGKTLPPGHELALGARVGLARTWIKLGRLDEAQAELSAVEPLFASTSALPHRIREVFHEAFIELYEARHADRPEGGYDRQAAEWRARLSEWQASTQPATP